MQSLVASDFSHVHGYVPNNSFNPTAEVGPFHFQPPSVGVGLIQVLGASAKTNRERSFASRKFFALPGVMHRNTHHPAVRTSPFPKFVASSVGQALSSGEH